MFVEVVLDINAMFGLALILHVLGFHELEIRKYLIRTDNRWAYHYFSVGLIKHFLPEVVKVCAAVFVDRELRFGDCYCLLGLRVQFGRPLERLDSHLALLLQFVDSGSAFIVRSRL